MSASISIMEKNNKICPRCGKPHWRFNRGVCFNCYRKYLWPRKKKVCQKYGRSMFLKAKGLCGGCYNTTYFLDYQKARNQMQLYGLDFETYKRITQQCVICGFDKFVALHHLDYNRKNNSVDNLVGLCPNHHQMLHTLKYKDEIFKLLKEKGFNPQEKKLRIDVKGSY